MDGSERGGTALPPRQEPVGWRRIQPALPAFDFGMLFTLMVAVTTARFGPSWPTYPAGAYIGSFAVTSLLLITAYYLAGLYDPSPRLGAPPAGAKILSASAVAVGVWAAVQLAGGALIADTDTRPLPMPLGVMAAVLLAGSALIAGRHRLSRKLRDRWAGPPRLLLLGAAEATAAARAGLADDPTVLVVAETDAPEAVLSLAADAAVTDVLVLDGVHLDRCFPEPLSTLEAAGVTVLRQLTTTHALLGIQRIREVGGLPFVLLRFQTVPRSQRRFKRGLELLVLSATVWLWLPLLAATALYVRAVAGSPVLYRQVRVGQAGQLFTVVKFRTMVPDAEVGGPQLSFDGDDRVVPGCRWLRSTRLDELPQLFNVLGGTMSLVGPRPERPELICDLEAQLPGYDRRHELPPGLTGLAQVHGRYATGARYKLGYDLQYLSSWSVWLELSILARTLWVVFTRRQ